MYTLSPSMLFISPSSAARGSSTAAASRHSLSLSTSPTHRHFKTLDPREQARFSPHQLKQTDWVFVRYYSVVLLGLEAVDLLRGPSCQTTS